MSRAFTVTIISVVVVLVTLGTWWFLTAQTNQPLENSNNQISTPSANGITIVFTDNGFQQQNYSVAAGQTVTVKNESSIVVQFSSDEHPTHTDNPELNMNELQPGEQDIIAPDTAGKWGIHDHEHPEFTTTLIVTG